MDLELQVRHFDLTDTVREYVERKVGRLDRFLPDIRVTRVELGRGMRRSQGDVYTAQVTSWVGGSILRVEEMNPDLFAAIDLASEKLHRQIERFKGKRQQRRHGAKREDAPVEEADEEHVSTIVRRKRFQIMPMSEEEAVDQLHLLDHDFFLYLDDDSGAVNVIYRRKDGQLGLIHTQRA